MYSCPGLSLGLLGFFSLFAFGVPSLVSLFCSLIGRGALLIRLGVTAFSILPFQILNYSRSSLMMRYGPCRRDRSFIYPIAAKRSSGEVYSGSLSVKKESPAAMVSLNCTRSS